MEKRLTRTTMLWQQESLKKLWIADQRDDFEAFDKLYGDFVQSFDDAYEDIKERTKGGKVKRSTKGSTEISV